MAETQRPTLPVEERTELGSRPTRRLRRAGWVPGIVYGAVDRPLPFRVGARELRVALQNPSAVLDLEIDGGQTRPVIVKEQQRHPVRDDVVHIDLLQVNLNETIHSTVAVELEGTDEAPGSIEGGVLEQVTRELNIEALPTDIPERVVVDVSGMQAADTLVLSAVPAPSGVTFLDDPDETVIATITVPTQVELPEEVEEETQIVGEEAVVTDVPAEGEGQPSGGAPTEGEAGARTGHLDVLILSSVRRPADATMPKGEGGRVDWLIVGLGNPGERYARTPHSIGFEVARALLEHWELPRAAKRYAGLFSDGRTGPGGPRVGVLLPQTFMNEAGRSAGPARGALGVSLDRVLVIHDEIDLPFGEVRTRLGGGLAGHNGLRSLKRELGAPDFHRLRVGVGRPDSTDPEIVAGYVLGRFRQSREEVADLVERAARAVEDLVAGPR